MNQPDRCEPAGPNHGGRPQRASANPVQPRMAGQVELSRDIRVVSEECDLKRLEYLEQRHIWIIDDYIKQNDSKRLIISEPIEEDWSNRRTIKWDSFVTDDTDWSRGRWRCDSYHYHMTLSVALAEKHCLSKNGRRLYVSRDVHTTGSSTAETNKREAQTTESDVAEMGAMLDEAAEVQEKSVTDNDAFESLSTPGDERGHPTVRSSSGASRSADIVGVGKCDVDTSEAHEDRSTTHDVKDATLQRAEHIHQRSTAETHRVMPNDSSNDNVVNGLDFDDPPDCNLVGEARHLDQLIAAGWKTINLQVPNISFIDASAEVPGVTTTVSMVKRALSSEMNDKEIKISRYKCRDLHLNRSLHFDCSHTARPPGAAAA